MIPIFLILFLSFIGHGNAGETIIKDLQVRNSRQISFIHDTILTDGSFPYVTCDFEEKKEAECQLHLTKLSAPEVVYPFQYSPSQYRRVLAIADVQLKSNMLYFLMQERDIDHDNPSKDQDKIDYVCGIALNLTTREVFKLALPSDLQYEDQFIGSIPTSDGIEIVVGHNPVCAGLDYCKLKFNRQGQQQGSPVPFSTTYHKMYTLPKSEGSLDKGTFAFGPIDSQKTSWEVTYTSENSDPVILKTFKVFRNMPIMSNTRDMYGICWQTLENREKSSCVRYDWISNITNPINYDRTQLKREGVDSVLVSFANLDNDYMLFTNLECGKNAGPKCKTATISKVSLKGELLKTSQIFNDLKCYDPHPIISTITEKGDEYCVYLVCSTDGFITSTPRLHVKCIPTSEFN
ncbi:hypothetical protein QAD02_011402 [Eretmocerus hayati]|uniref:Uncharacterized protein n=1 Tax=Eretmocerus hayati TaxID=131215 RepID=A0ACC2NXT8_9HYME|nr:hypothetical protein QAD02_011402 [Eretmocerus hayati]